MPEIEKSEKKTNGEWLRSMGNIMLSKLMHHYLLDFCPGNDCKYDCDQCYLKWLNAEVNEDFVKAFEAQYGENKDATEA